MRLRLLAFIATKFKLEQGKVAPLPLRVFRVILFPIDSLKMHLLGYGSGINDHFTIYGIKYSAAIFANFGGGLREGIPFIIRKRQNNTIILESFPTLTDIDLRVLVRKKKDEKTIEGSIEEKESILRP